MPRVIHLHVAAPVKPVAGAACNGCGVCCAWAPCPVGQLFSRRRSGACAALQWSDAERRYRCGIVAEPAAHLPKPLRWTAPLAARLARRWIAAGSGCDAHLHVEPGDRRGPAILA